MIRLQDPQDPAAVRRGFGACVLQQNIAASCEARSSGQVPRIEAARVAPVVRSYRLSASDGVSCLAWLSSTTSLRREAAVLLSRRATSKDFARRLSRAARLCQSLDTRTRRTIKAAAGSPMTVADPSKGGIVPWLIVAWQCPRRLVANKTSVQVLRH